MNIIIRLGTKRVVVLFIIVLIIATIPTIQSLHQVSAANQEYGTLSGYVVTPVGTPIPGVLVRVYFHGTYRDNYSDAMGYYHVTDIPICYCLKNCTASHPWYHPEWIWMGIVEDSTHTFVLIPKNSSGIPPPYGPTQGNVTEPLTFFFDIPQNSLYDNIFLQWYWGDGTTSDWYGPYDSGQTVSATHTWNVPGIYHIIVRLKDIYGTVYTSDPHTIIIYGNENLVILPGYIKGGFNKVSSRIDNIGDSVATNIHWTIDIQGGITGNIKTKTSGIIPTLEKDSYTTIETDHPIFGLGVIGITVTAQADHSEPVTEHIFGIILCIYVYTPPLL